MDQRTLTHGDTGFSGVLDQFSTAPTVAYSNKLLKASLLGTDLLTCYDSSVPTEDDFRVESTTDAFGTPSDHINDSAENPSEWSTATPTVAGWVNQANPGTYDLVQATASAQPEYGKDFLAFDADDHLQGSSAPSLNYSNPFTIAFVVRSTSSSTTQNIMTTQVNGFSDLRVQVSGSGTFGRVLWGGGDLDGGTGAIRCQNAPMKVNDSQLRYAIIRYNGSGIADPANHNLIIGGASQSLTTTPTFSAVNPGLRIGTYTGSNSIVGQVPCMFFWHNHYVENEDLTLLQAHLDSYTP